ncbi:MAG: flagellin [Paracoccaceae bacterium]|nr:MAG: flagellin [Paracoccaceae bacterium]
MSSIMTNTSAMVALQTMKGINANMNKTQSEISTGKTVATAKDNAAIWAISKVMESDVKGFKGIADSLSLGSSTISVARQASETVTNLLTEIKGKIVAAQEENVDRTKIQADISKLRDQIASVVGAAQFNGLNLVNGTQGTVNVLSSLDRGTGGTVATSSISVAAQDLTAGGYTAAAVLGSNTTGVSTNGDTAGFALDSGGGTGTLEFDGANFAAGDSVGVTIGGKTVSYTLSDADVASTSPGDIVAVALKQKIEALGFADLAVDYDSGTAQTLSFTNDGTNDLAVSVQFKNAGSGGLAALAGIDVTTQSGAAAALGNIEALQQTAINAAAEFGSVQGRIDIQNDFVSKLSDALKAGIGTLVDADMEEASARLQALQVQQQLGIQALSIANQQPQNILALFR